MPLKLFFPTDPHPTVSVCRRHQCSPVYNDVQLRMNRQRLHISLCLEYGENNKNNGTTLLKITFIPIIKAASCSKGVVRICVKHMDYYVL